MCVLLRSLDGSNLPVIVLVTRPSRTARLLSCSAFIVNLISISTSLMAPKAVCTSDRLVITNVSSAWRIWSFDLFLGTIVLSGFRLTSPAMKPNHSEFLSLTQNLPLSLKWIWRDSSTNLYLLFDRIYWSCWRSSSHSYGVGFVKPEGIDVKGDYIERNSFILNVCPSLSDVFRLIFGLLSPKATSQHRLHTIERPI